MNNMWILSRRGFVQILWMVEPDKYLRLLTWYKPIYIYTHNMSWDFMTTLRWWFRFFQGPSWWHLLLAEWIDPVERGVWNQGTQMVDDEMEKYNKKWE